MEDGLLEQRTRLEHQKARLKKQQCEIFEYCLKNIFAFLKEQYGVAFVKELHKELYAAKKG